MPAPGALRTTTRATIVEVAARLLREQGPVAVTTRGVAHGAGVQAPTIYRLFGDKDGLLEAVAEHTLESFVAAKAAIVEAAEADDADPLEDLRASWFLQIEFALVHPHVFHLLNDPERAQRSPAAQAGLRVLEARVHRVATAGLLRVSEPRAVGIIRAAGVGTVTTILATAPDDRDPGLPEAMHDAVLRQILVGAPTPASEGPRATAVALRAMASQLRALSPSERRLLVDWLDRVIDDPRPSGRSGESRRIPERERAADRDLHLDRG